MKSSPAPSLRFADFELDIAAYRLTRLGEPVHLERRAFDLLVFLAERAGRTVARDELIATLWPGPAVIDFDAGLNTLMHKIRQALGDSSESPTVVETVPRRGYRFIAPVDVGHDEVPHPVGGRSKAPMSEPTEAIPPDRPSLAALPFVNLSNDPDQDYFVAGTTQEVITSLGRIRSIFVISGTATVSMEDFAHDPQAAARRLGVRYILQGSVRRAGPRVRIAVTLTDSMSGVQIWGDRFEDTVDDVFALQDRVALSVAAAVEPNISAAELRRATRSPVDHLGCYDLYLRAAHLRTTLRRSEVMRALELLEKAMAINPEYAPVLAQAAGCHSQIYVNRWADDYESHRAQGLMLAERAERAAGDDSAVLTQIANALTDLSHIQSHNIDRALALIERATAINPGSAYAWFISGVLKLIDGRGGRAVEDLERVMRLDPVSPLMELAQAHIGCGLAMQGDYEAALRTLLATGYRTPRIQLMVAYTYARTGRLSQACDELAAYEQMSSVPAETMLEHMSRSPEFQTQLRETLVEVRAASANI